jgi:hypothetical protein
MIDDLDDLARSAADTLVSAMVTDSWEAVKSRIANLIGRDHGRRIDATRAVMSGADGQELERAKLRETRLWTTRFRDLLDDDANAAAALRELIDDLHVGVAASTPASQHAQAGHGGHGSQAVNVGGNITGNTGDVYIGVGKVDKRRRIFMIPVTFFIRITQKVIAGHPIVAVAAAGAVVAAASAGVVLARSGGDTVPAVLAATFTAPGGASMDYFVLSHDGTLVAAAASQSDGVYVWDTVTHERLATLAVPDEGVATPVAFSPDDKDLLVDSDNTLYWLAISSGSVASAVSYADYASADFARGISGNGAVMAREN